ncbi:YlmC/YmxH family sporulation protein [Clostridium sp. MSJ-8]|uniref:YlmC/YmxH family sporulation protein n=1 Tax=Clostridium sp. MSJ-8 TaxID=2841510 RepID=UPI001C0ED2FA|nr:YlmC/YmxH family sporulation protein [Clostridium sp. MSJ-8]MBU5488691.1 YlmC/YmxH family sporulation protein [Clostridium sp. MSJ-8]
MVSEEKIKTLREIGSYEIININDGEKYDCLQNNDLVVDEEGNLRYLIINIGKSKLSLFSTTREFLEIPWRCVKKIGAKTIILDAEKDDIKKGQL